MEKSRSRRCGAMGITAAAGSTVCNTTSTSTTSSTSASSSFGRVQHVLLVVSLLVVVATIVAAMAETEAVEAARSTGPAETDLERAPRENGRHLGQTSNNKSNSAKKRSWPTLISKRRTIPPYDVHRYVHISEWDPFSPLPPRALPLSERPNFGHSQTQKPTSGPTPEGYDAWDQFPPTLAPRPTPSPSLGPTALSDFSSNCGVDGHGFLVAATLRDRWGDGWDGSYLTVTESATQRPVYSATLTARDGKSRTDHLCLKVWTCYDVRVSSSRPTTVGAGSAGSQWGSDEISWSIDRLEEVGAYMHFYLSANRAQDNYLGLDKQLGYGTGAGTGCSLALTDVGLMDGCGMTCDGRSENGMSSGNGGGANRRPTRAPTPVPTPAMTISDDVGTYMYDAGGGGTAAAARQPTVPAGFGNGGGGGGTAYQRPTSSAFPFGFGFGTTQQRPSDPNAPPFDMSGGGATPVRGTDPRPAPAPTTAKPTLPPAMAGAPVRRPPGYFNYDPFDGYYGPAAWDKWWPGCGTGVHRFDQSGVGLASSLGPGRQSPIHLSRDGTNVHCEATHEIRTRAAEFNLCDEEAGLFTVTPSRLRLDFTAQKKNPETDLPDGFGVMTARYLEVAYPALHTVEDEGGRWRRYDAEYTIVHDFDRREKATLISILIDATGHRNERFQDLLDEWSKVDTCRTPANEEQFLKQMEQYADDRRLRGAASDVSKRAVGASTAPQEAGSRELACAFNIYHRTLMPSTYYYGYQGSLPEPPCTYKDYLPGTSEWRVINKPMKIAKTQLEQLKSIVEQGPCKGNDYAQDMGIWRARPVQESFERPYWQCQREAFPLDCERDGGWCDCDAILCPSDFI